LSGNATNQEFAQICDNNLGRREDYVALVNMVDQTERRATHSWENPTWWYLLVLLPWTLGAIFAIYQWNVDRRIATREQTTQGVITAHEPANHNRFGYAFSVDGKRFTGWESPGKDELEIGRSVLVYYDPINPSRNALTEFREKGVNSLGPVPLILFGIGAVTWYLKTQRRKRLAQI
jgi:Protein of unknown function (DUF3592)